MAGIDIASAFAGMAMAVYGSFAGWGAWCLVAQQFALWTCRLSLVALSARFLPRLVFRYSFVKSSFGFGAGVVGSSFVGFIGGNLDNILIGTLLGTTALGFYSIAFQIIAIPTLVLGAVHYSLLPAISNAHNNGISPAKTYLEAARVVLVIAAPAMVGLALTADMLVALLLGDAWKPVASLVQLLAPFGLLNVFFVLNSSLLLATGRSGLEFRTTILRAVCAAAGIIIGLYGGSEGVAAGVSIGFAIAGVFYIRAVLGVCDISASALWQTARAPLLSCVVLAFGVLLLRLSALNNVTLLPAMLVSALSGAAIYFLALFFGFRAVFIGDLLRIRSLVTKRAI
jgi:O-antigen/teichoic acid export membrane protein